MMDGFVNGCAKRKRRVIRQERPWINVLLTEDGGGKRLYDINIKIQTVFRG